MSAELAGRSADEVLRLLRDRLARKQRGEPIADGHKLSLVVEGGAMRGVYSAGALYALDILGCHDLFDAVYATSAGAVNATYFLAGQGAFAVGTYHQDLNGRHFINPLRFWKVVNIDYLEREVFGVRKPIDSKAIRTSRTRFVVALTDMQTGQAAPLDVQASSASVETVLKAATALPVFYNRSVRVEGRRYVDGGLTNPIPIRWALDDGATHVLALLTRPDGYRMTPPAAWERAVCWGVFARGNRRLQAAFHRFWTVYNESVQTALGRSGDRAAVAALRPAADIVNVTGLTTDGDRLRAATHSMTEGVLGLLGARPPDFHSRPHAPREESPSRGA